MNPDQAYRMHTDWARAVQRPGTPTSDWFAARMSGQCRPLGPDTLNETRFRIFSEPQTFSAMARFGPTVQTKIIVGWEPREPDPDEVPTDVFAEPGPEPGPLSLTANSVCVPEMVYAEATPHILASAPTYYVTRDMCTIIEVAAEAFDDFDLMPRLPASSGFVVLARPINLDMPDGAVQPVHAFAWNTWGDAITSMGTPGMLGEVWTFASRKTDADFELVVEAAQRWPSKKAWQSDPDLLPCFADWVCTGIPVGPISETVAVASARNQAHHWVQQRTAKMPLNEDGSRVVPPAAEWEAILAAAQAREDQALAAATEEDRTNRFGRFQPYLAAFVLLLTQQITVAEPEHPTTDAVRLAKQVGECRPEAVTVVDIRHSSRPHRDDTDEADETGTGHRRGPLTHRHLVGSHWKWQPYGKDRALRRRIFVAGYVRGPEDKPLVVKPRVTRL